MQTDDQYAVDLSVALRASTADLSYTGRVPKPSRPMLVAAPAIAAGVAGAVLVVAVCSNSGHAKLANPPSPTVHPTVRSALSGQALAIHRLKLDGYLRSYEGSGGQSFYARRVDQVPSSAQREPDDAGVAAYVGVDPTTGYSTAYVVSADNGTLAITAPGATVEQLKAMLEGGAPRAVPLVGGAN